MLRLRQAQWDALLSELERGADGASIHNARQLFSWTKARVEMWRGHHNNPDKYGSDQENQTWLEEASAQLEKYGYPDYALFIEEI